MVHGHTLQPGHLRVRRVPEAYTTSKPWRLRGAGDLLLAAYCLAFHPQTAAELNNGQVNKHNEKQTQVTNIQQAEGSGRTSLTVPLETARGHTKGKQRQGSG